MTFLGQIFQIFQPANKNAIKHIFHLIKYDFLYCEDNEHGGTVRSR